MIDMNMTKFATKASITLGAALGLGLFIAQQPAHAATWHKGTPSAVRGTWKTKSTSIAVGSKKQTAYDKVTIAKNALSDYSYTGKNKLGMKGTSAKYAVTGKYTYIIKAKVAKNVTLTLHVKKSSSKVIVIGNGTKNTNPAKYYKA
ncbi:hypothetical protein CLI91_02605 [Lentilactobacillus hilgardii]|nr:hypothetical protein HMPREF0496_1877 [Lentilactobacillus hilgardii ATCC 27305]MBZ2200254.1 hypothetical protein [Lentilactobacillus hilgardii]